MIHLILLVLFGVRLFLWGPFRGSLFWPLFGVPLWISLWIRLWSRSVGPFWVHSLRSVFGYILGVPFGVPFRVPLWGLSLTSFFAPLPLSLLDPSLGYFFGVWNPYLSVPFGGLFVIAHGVPIGVPLWGRISSFINYFVQTHLRSSNSLFTGFWKWSSG